MSPGLIGVLYLSLLGAAPSAENDPFADRQPKLTSKGVSEPATSKKPRAGEWKVPSESEIVALVEQLVSSNREPEIDEARWSVKHAQGFDKRARDRVFQAWERLRDIGLPAFPYLQSHFGDKRYCFTQDDGPGYYNFSVGEASERILISHLQPYLEQANPGGDLEALALWRRYPRPSNYFSQQKLSQPNQFDQWWRTHKHKSMQEIQIEVLEWTIAQARPQANTGKLVKHLNETLAALRSAKEPLPPGWPFAK